MCIRDRSESVWKYYGLLEESIRLALSFLVLFSKQGIPTTLTTNGRDIVTGRPIQVGQGAGPAHITHCSRQLARIDLEQTPGDFTDCLLYTSFLWPGGGFLRTAGQGAAG